MYVYFVGPDAEARSDVVYDVLDGQDRLRSAESTHGCVRRQIGLTDVTDGAKVGDVVAVVATAQRAMHHLQP